MRAEVLTGTEKEQLYTPRKVSSLKDCISGYHSNMCPPQGGQGGGLWRNTGWESQMLGDYDANKMMENDYCNGPEIGRTSWQAQAQL